MDEPAEPSMPGTNSLGERLGALHRRLLADVPQVDRIGCALYDPGDDLLKTFVHSTRSGEALRGYEFKLSDSRSLHEMSQSGHLRLLADIPAALSPGTAHSAWVLKEGYRSSMTVPMFGHGVFSGFLFFDSRRLNAFSDTDQRHLLLYANLISLLISGELLSIRALAGSVDVARAFCDLRDFETGTHLDRMSRYARLIAKEMALAKGFTDEFVEHVFLFSPLHDIGKIGIPDHILLKPGPLEGEDREIMRTHVDRGCAVIGKMIDDLSLHHLPDIAILRNIIEFHHEYLDGSGYPKGLRGKDIPIEARIATIADIFDALTSPRPYKPAWSIEKAMEELGRMAAAGQLDSDAVAALRLRSAEARAIRRKYLDAPIGGNPP